MVNNLTNLTSAENLYDLIIYTNSVTNGIMVAGFIITFVAIIFVFNIRKIDFPIQKNLLLCSFVGLVLSIPLVSMSLLNFQYILVFASLLVLSGFWSYFSK